MFTGIVESTGTVVSLENDILKIKTDNTQFFDLDSGTSIAIDGCCLTLKNYEKDILIFQVSDETLNRTAVGDNHREHVNLDIPLTLNSILSRHLVQGQVYEVINIHSNKNLDCE